MKSVVKIMMLLMMMVMVVAILMVMIIMVVQIHKLFSFNISIVSLKVFTVTVYSGVVKFTVIFKGPRQYQ